MAMISLAGVPNTTAFTLSMWFQIPTGLDATDNWLSLWEMGGIPPTWGTSLPTFSFVDEGSELTGPIPLGPEWNAPGVNYGGPINIWKDFSGNILRAPWDPNDPAYTGMNGTYGTDAVYFCVSGGSSLDDPCIPGNIYTLHASASPELINWAITSYIAVRGAADALYLDCKIYSAVQPLPFTGDPPEEANRTGYPHLQAITNPSVRPITAGAWHHLVVAAQMNTTGGNYLVGNPDATTKLHKLVILLDGVAANHVATPADSIPGVLDVDLLVDDTVNPYRYAAQGPGTAGFLMGGVHMPLNPSAGISSNFSVNYDQSGGGIPGGTRSNKVRRFQDIQFWTDQFIDPRIAENFANFVTITGTTGTPTSTTSAANAFGQQSILLKGKASDQSFYVNRGTLGPVALTGTAADFTPTASYG